MEVTPGYEPQDNEPITPAQLRLIATPSVTITDEEIIPAMVDLPALSTALQVSAGKANYIGNPNFNPTTWPKGAGPLVAASGSYTELATGWAVKPSTGRVTQERTTQVTTVTGDTKKSVYSLQINGSASSTGTVEIKTDIPRYLSASLRTTIALSFQIYNGTGASITPTISWSTPAAADDFTTPTEVATSSCGVCTNAQWTKVTINNIAATAWANLDLGLRLAVIIPSGGISGVGKSVYLSQFKLELVAATEFLPEPEPPIVVNENYFQNGNFDTWAYTGSTAQSGNAVSWTGAMTRSTDQALAGTSYSAKLTGTGSALDYGQTVTGAETKQDLTFSCWLYNASAAEITPTLRVDLAGGANQFSSSLTPCPVSVWTKLTATIPAGGYAITATGILVTLRLTVTNTQNVYLSQMKLEPGTAATRMRRIVEPAPSFPFANYRNLRISVNLSFGMAGNITVTADEILMKSAAGVYMRSTSFGSSALIYSTTLAVGGRDYSGTMTTATWHYVYAVADKDGVTNFILSKSSSAPTLPAGYIYYLLLGAVLSKSTSEFEPMLQLNNLAVCARQDTITGGFIGAGALTPGLGITSWTPADVTPYVPPIATSIRGLAGVTTSGTHYGFSLAANQPSSDDDICGLQVISGVGHTGTADMSVYFGCGRFELPYAATVYWKTHDTTTNKRADITGWTL